MTLNELHKENIREYGKNINRHKWIKNWKEKVLWSQYFDYTMADVEDAITEYCKKNDLEFVIDGGYVYCISNRKQYNDLMSICDDILGDLYGDEEEA